MRKKLGELLVESGAVSASGVQAALKHQAGGDRRRLGELLVAAGALQPRQLAEALGAQAGLPVVRLEQVSEKAAALVPLDFQVESRLVLFGLEGEGGAERLQVAVEDAAQLEVVDELGFQMQRELRVFIASRDDIAAAHAFLRGERPLEPDEPEFVVDDDDASVPVVGGELVGAELAPPETPTLELPSEWAESVAEEPSVPVPVLAAAGGSGVPAAPPVLRPGAPAGPSVPGGRGPEVLPLPGSQAPRPVAPVHAELPARPVPEAPRPASPVPLPSAAPAVAARAAPVPLPGAAPAAAARSTPAPLPGAAPAAPARAAPLPPPGAAPAAARPTPVPSPVAPVRPATGPEAAGRQRLDFSEDDLRILDAIDRLAAGADELVEVEKVRPARMVASLVRLLMRKGVIHELEFLEELSRK